MTRVLVGGILLVAVVAALGVSAWPRRPEPTDPSARPDRPRDEFAADRTPAAVATVPFDARRALGYLDAICRIGPRLSGSDGMKRQQELLQKHFEIHGGQLTWQRFTAQQRSQRQPVALANLIVRFHPERNRRVLLCSHYDTRPIADQEPDRRRWHQPFLSANDGGSGVAFLMELTHHLKDLKTQVGIDFAFFDGEEYIFEPTDQYFFGSEHFAQAYRADKPPYRYVAAVLLDMIAGKGPHFPVERNSYFHAAGLVQELWRIAAEQRCAAFEDRLGPDVLDDHIALNRAGIPAVDIIDFSYPHWHRLSDVPANCAPEGLEQVARVLGVWLQRVH